MRELSPPRWRDTAFAACLALVLGAGVLGVLLLNTSMQQQSDRMNQQHQRIADLNQQVQLLRSSLDWAADPSLLDARARALRLRPAKRVRYVRADSLSAPRQAARLAPAG